MDVEGVVRISPDGPVAVRFPSSAGTASVGAPVEARSATTLSCAGNVRHGARLRLVSGPDDRPAVGGAGTIEWSDDAGESWTPLDEGTARVAGPHPPGRRADCATVRFRWVPPAAGSPAHPPERVTVQFVAESLPARQRDSRK